MGGQRREFLARLASLLLFVALLVVRSNNFLKVREHLGGGVCATARFFAFCAIFRVSLLSLLTLLLVHLLHLTLSLPHSELLCHRQSLLSQLFLLVSCLGLEGSLDLAFLGGSLLPLLFLRKLSLLSEGAGVDSEDLPDGLLLAFRDFDRDGFFKEKCGYVLGLDLGLGLGGLRRVVEVREGVQVLEEVLADFFNLALEWSIRAVEFSLKERFRVDLKQLAGHVFGVQIAKTLLRLGEIHLVACLVESLAAVLVKEYGVVEQLVEDALLDQLFDLDGHFLGDRGRQLCRGIEIQVDVK